MVGTQAKGRWGECLRQWKEPERGAGDREHRSWEEPTVAGGEAAEEWDESGDRQGSCLREAGSRSHWPMFPWVPKNPGP